MSDRKVAKILKYGKYDRVRPLKLIIMNISRDIIHTY